MTDVLRHAARSCLSTLLASRRREWPDERFGDSALVIAPHQDDEVLGCGGTLLRKRDAGADVHLVFMTDGATSHARLMDPGRMRELRREEALEAADVLGLAPGAVTFFDYPNRELHTRLEDAAARILAILNEIGPTEVLTPWRYEPPTDHAAAFAATALALRRYSASVVVHEYPVWLWQQWPWCRPEHYQPPGRRAWWRAQLAANRALFSDFMTSVDVRDVASRKELALEQHRSQTTRLMDDPGWGVLADVCGGEFVERLFQPFEVFKTTLRSDDL